MLLYLNVRVACSGTGVRTVDKGISFNQSDLNSNNAEKSMSEASTRFLTAEDAATYLGSLNSRTVTRWAREGYLPSYPIGEGKRRLWRLCRRISMSGWLRVVRAVSSPLISMPK
jgi:hypothetical protein